MFIFARQTSNIAMPDPLFSILVFVIICVMVFLLLRPNGFYWIFLQGKKSNEKTVIEDILKELFHVEYENSKVRFRDLKVLSSVGGTTVMEVLNEMTQKGLVSNQNDFIVLEPKGREYALQIVRAHRVWEKYLAEKTGYDKSEWHNRAEKKEHELSVDETNQLASSLGSPHFDPHGDPIPTAGGTIQPQQGISLSLFPENTVGRIIHIEDEPEAVYKQILAENLHIGSQVRVVESTQEKIRFLSEGEEYILAPIVAENISMEMVQSDDVHSDNVLRLSSIGQQEEVEIIGISKECRGANRRRLLDLGFVPGTKVSLGITSPLNDPRAYKVRSTDIALRNDQADFILIKKRNQHESASA